MAPDSISLAAIPELANLALRRASVTVRGQSMRPALNDGDRVTVESLDGRAPGAGEIVIVLRNGTWVCHRVTRVERGRVFTKGDSLAQEDDPANPEDIVARVIEVQRGSRGLSLLRQAAATAWETATGYRVIRQACRTLQRQNPKILLAWPKRPGSRFMESISLEDGVARWKAGQTPKELALIIGALDRPTASLRLIPIGQGEWRVEDLRVRLRRRGFGLGTSLLNNAVRLARELGATLVHAEIPSGRRSALGALIKAGFREYATAGDRIMFLFSPARSSPFFSPLRKHAGELHPEERLLAAACAAGKNKTNFVSNGPVDWCALLLLARQHGASALLYDKFRAGTSQTVPHIVLEALRQSYYRNAAHWTRNNTSVKPFLERMMNSGHKVVALQGAALAQRFYGNPALRPMGDLDFLVQPEALKDAHSILTGLGFGKEGYGQYALREGTASTAALELHIPREYSYLDMNSLWERAVPAPDGLFNVPQREDLLVFLALHMSLHHAWYRLIWLSDLSRILAEEEKFDWEKALSLVEAPLRRWALLSALKTSVDILDADVPKAILDEAALKPQSPRATLLEWLWASPPMTGAGAFVMDVLCPPAGEIPRAVARRLWPAEDFMRRRYGANVFGYSALTRVKRLAVLSASALNLALKTGRRMVSGPVADR